MSSWKTVTTKEPCPACGKADWCAWTRDDWLKCERSSDPPTGMECAKVVDGGALFRPARLGNNGRTTSHKTRLTSAVANWKNEAERCTAALQADRLADLVRQLNVTPAALQSLGVGWASRSDLDRWRAGFGDGQRPDGAFVFPERDGSGRIIGLSLRAPDSRKGAPSGGKRGLIVPSGLHSKADPVLVVEGASDVAACEALGLTAVGRPSNSGGGDMLAALLDGRDILVVGENDAKETGEWPGRDGAKSVARRLASERGEPVRWVLPPSETKDIRASLKARIESGFDPSDREACRVSGARLLAELQVMTRTIKPGKGPSQAARLTNLTRDAELWHTPDADAYATILVADHHESYRVRSRAFRRWIVGRAYRDGGGVPNVEAVHAALGVIEARAVYDGDERAAHVRLAEHDGAVWLDLADADWRAVRIDADGWRVVDDPPVRFRRPRGLRPLPTPERGGDVRELGPLLNMDGDALALTMAWLLGTLNPRGPYPIVAIHGPQGSGKSCASRMLKALVDPAEPTTRTAPRDERDLCISAENSRIISLDNLSGLPLWLSNALCRLSTGGGLATRELYSDREETIFSATRPTIVNGIDDVATRPDLLNRCIVLNLEALPDSARRSEADLWRDFEAAWPRILGVLLNAASAAVRNLPDVRFDTLPRMADFAAWVVAGEAGLGLEPGAFLAAYFGNRDDANALALESSPVAGAMIELTEAVGEWEGTATALLAELFDRVPEVVRKPQSWPKTPRGLTSILRRIHPNLAACGVALTFKRRPGGLRERIIRAEKARDSSSQQSLPSRNSPDGPEQADSVGTIRDANGAVRDAGEADDRPAETPSSASVPTIRDGRDGRDAKMHRHSGVPCDEEGLLPTTASEAGVGRDSRGLDVPAGWTATRWANRLRQLATACESTNPERAAELRRQAKRLEKSA